jgi:chromosome segregation protein
VFLRRVEVTGFKSFADKTVVDLEPGITAIVGPNGSGKSNLADAIRWAFGEQSKGRLRLDERDEVVFAGTEKRARASYAEVVLLFNNEDRTFPLDLTEVEVSRRLYRSGESVYRLAGRAVRLSDIQGVLAGAGVGAGSYAIIGQGMIDSFLLSSPAERKLLFEEAAGIRSMEAGREAAIRKLEATSQNLVRLSDIIAELAPHLASLEQSVSAAEVRRDLEAKVTLLKDAVAASGLGHWTTIHDDAKTKLAEIVAKTKQLTSEQAALEKQLSDAESMAASIAGQRKTLGDQIAALELERDRLGLELATCQAEATEAKRSKDHVKELTSKLAEVSADLDIALARDGELESDLTANTSSADRAQIAVNEAAKGVAIAQAALVAVRKSATSDSARDKYVDHALELLKTLAVDLGKQDVTIGQIRLAVHKLGALLSHARGGQATDLLADLKAAQKQLENAMAKRETAIEHQTNITITSRSLEIDQIHQAEAVKRAEGRVQEIKSELERAEDYAAKLQDLPAKVVSAEMALAQVSSSLEALRAGIRDLDSGTDGSQPLADTAAALERVKGGRSAADAEARLLDENLTTALSALETGRSLVGEKVPAVHESLSHLSLGELETKLVQVTAQLEAHSTLTRDQTAEYEAVRTRHSDLSSQIADLEVARADLEGIIADLDGHIRQRFKQNFESLAHKFNQYFQRLFEGGTASLELTDTDDGGYGIAIKASPKGKRRSSLTALSGGERALAGVALLAAILEVNRSPFIVLDEVDAALDEANSGRLAEILGELKHQSQLIVITHNRQIMQAARVLFGVTLSEQHVSHLLSLRLEEASALAVR